MLERIEKLEHIGLFNSAEGFKFRFGANTLIYADNGRGKSTLCSLFYSLASNAPDMLRQRQTIDDAGDITASLQFSNGQRSCFAASTGWDVPRPELLIFDTDFINRNVHSGGEVTPTHRQNLLAFVLGSSAVQAQAALEASDFALTKAKESAEVCMREVDSDRGELSIAEFSALPVVPDVDMRISELEERRVDIRNVGMILARETGIRLQLPTMDLEEFFEVIRRNLEDVHDAAEEIVSRHLAVLADETAERWLREGIGLERDDKCPYCGQSTTALTLVKSYRAHFNAEYRALATDVEALSATIDTFAGDLAREAFSGAVRHRNELFDQWNEHCTLELLEVDQGELESRMSAVSTALTALVQSKNQNMASAVGTDDEFNAASVSWRRLVELFIEQNVAIDRNVAIIEAFKSTLTSATEQEITAQIVRRYLEKTRHEKSSVDKLGAFVTAKEDVKQAEKVKRDARLALRDVMAQTLLKYKTDINSYLMKLGATFSIEEISTNFLSNAARSEYAIRMRGRSIKPGFGTPSFSTALSDGDKRTLAFAFFVASTLGDADIARKVVIVDDPVSSLDRSRREFTREILRELSVACEQLIVLTHDANLVRELRDLLHSHPQTTDALIHKLVRTAGDYTTFGEVDIDLECETAYFRNYRIIDQFIRADHLNAREAARAIRPLIEGYLHRRFPAILPSDQMLGSAIATIEKAEVSSPLVHAQNIATELREINAYASRFHHDTNPGYNETDPISEAVVVKFGRRALAVIYGEHIPG